mgnify:CR=1 FL=1
MPNYEVFDEERYFEPGEGACVFELNGLRVGVNICADVWESGAAEVARDAGAELLLVLNASPFHMHKQGLRYEVLRERIADIHPGCRVHAVEDFVEPENWPALLPIEVDGVLDDRARRMMNAPNRHIATDR